MMRNSWISCAAPAESIRETADFALQSRIDTIQFMALTPFPGTSFYERMDREGRIVTRDWSLYDGHHAVFVPALMSPGELQREMIGAMKSFYSLGNIFKNVSHTGWTSALYRVIGWGITRHFEIRNRWYNRHLEHQENFGSRPVTLLYRLFHAPAKEKSLQPDLSTTPLRISVTEQKGVLYLKVRGLTGMVQLKELKRTLKGILPRYYSQMVVNTEGMRFASEKAAAGFGRYLEKLGAGARRLQVITAAEKHSRSLLQGLKKKRKKLPRFELLVQRR